MFAQVERRSLSIRVRENLRERLRRLIAGELRSHEKLLVERNGYEGAELSAGGAHRRHLCGCRGRGSVLGAGSGVPSLNAELHVSVRRGNSSGGAAADGEGKGRDDGNHDCNRTPRGSSHVFFCTTQVGRSCGRPRL